MDKMSGSLDSLVTWLVGCLANGVNVDQQLGQLYELMRSIRSGSGSGSD